jgi:hypothetical protein
VNLETLNSNSVGVFCEDTASNEISFTFESTSGGVFTIQLYITSSGGVLSQTYDLSGISIDTWYNFVWAWDTVGQTSNVWMNGSILTPASSTWTKTATLPSGGWIVEFGSTQNICAGDVWLETGTDLSSAPAAFYSGGYPVSLGTNGSVPTGVEPQVFLTVPYGDAASTFLSNSGSGGSFIQSAGTIALCSSGPYPPSTPSGPYFMNAGMF